MGKRPQKRKASKLVENEECPAEVKPVRLSDEPIPKKVKWINRERVLVLATRGISYQHRHLMKDLEKLLPHSRHGNKMERKENLFEVNHMCQLQNCNKCVLFDGRLHRDLYMWIANIPKGPSAKFLVENIYTSAELKLTGNCLTGSRPILSFDNSFIEHPHFSVLRELFIQIFGVPNHHPKSQPFTDHVIAFSVLDSKIWYRNYQIVNEQGAIAEIGPRFVLNPIKIFSGSFSGDTLWENPHFITPSKTRRILLESKKNKYLHRKEQRKNRRKHNVENPLAPENEIFEGETIHVAHRLSKKLKDGKLLQDKGDKIRNKKAHKNLKKKTNSK